MSILREKIVREHIEEYYPDATMMNYNDADCDLEFYSAEQLGEIDGDWFPLCCYVDEESGQTLYGGRKRIVHTYTEGETGAGKTTRFVMQSIRALSAMKVKPSFVIVDIHGEIIENLYGHLKKNGYNIKILNCDDPERSDTYNPFFEMAEECLRTRSIGTDTLNKIRRIAEIIQPVESKNDPIWDIGARAYTNGCILDKFEDLVNGDIPKGSVNIYNIIQNHYWLRKFFSDGYGSGHLLNIPHYKKKGDKAWSVQKMIAVTDNADKTRASYFGVVENHYDAFGQPTLYMLSSNNTISISDFINRPTAIVIQSGSTKVGDALISLLVNDIYTQVVKLGKQSPTKRLPRNIHCFLDEFANCDIADGPEYIKMLTTSRKFGMFWHMILQCDAQLDRKFDAHIARIIRANSTEIFMGSHDYETAARFAKSCGQKTIESLASIVSQNSPVLTTVDLMTAERLNLIEEGYAYVKCNKRPLLKTYIEAFYNCEDFVSERYEGDIYPHNTFCYFATAFFPDDIQNKKYNEEAVSVNNPFEISEVDAEDDPITSQLDFFDEFVENNPLLRELEAHLEGRAKQDIDKVISGITMIPVFLKQAIERIFLDGDIYEFSTNPNVLKFEIIEEYIRNNDFKKKREWDSRIQQEYDCLKENDIFPEVIMRSFQQAVREIKEELTLSNIKEIKKIITDSETE